MTTRHRVSVEGSGKQAPTRSSAVAVIADRTGKLSNRFRLQV